MPVLRHLAGAFTALAFLAPATPLFAMTLEEAWQYGLSHSEQVSLSDKSLDIAKAQLGIAKSARLPSVSLQAFDVVLDHPLEVKPNLPDQLSVDQIGVGPIGPIGPVNIPLPFPVNVPVPDDLKSFKLGSQNFYQAGLRATMPIYTGGQLSNFVDAAKARVEATAWQQQQTLQQLMLNIANAYVGVLRARQAVIATDQQVATLQQHVNDVQNLYDQQLVDRGDLLSVQSTMAQAEQRRLQAHNAVELASSLFNRLLNRPLATKVDLADLQAPNQLPDVDQLISQAQSERSEIKAVQAQIQSLEHVVEAVRGRRMPQVGLVAGYNYVGLDAVKQKGLGYGGVSLSWNIFDFGGTSNQVRVALGQLGTAKDQFALAKEGIALQVRQAWLDLQESKNRIDVAKRGLEYAEKELSDARDRYENNLAPNSEVLDAEARRTGNYTLYYNAIYDAVLSELRLRSVAGGLRPETMLAGHDKES